MTLSSSPADLTSLETEWPALEAAARLPTQTRAWVTACAESFREIGGLAIVTSKSRRGLAPLTRRGPALTLLGAQELSEPSDLLATNETALAELAREIIELGRPIRLERVPADSPTVTALAEAGGGRVIVRPREGSPWIPLDKRWGEPEAMLSSRRRADLRRGRRRAKKDGPVRTEVSAPEPGEVEDLLRVAWDVESRSWRHARAGTIAQDPLRGPFFRRWAQLAAEAGSLRIALLYSGDKAIAMQLATVVANGYWILKIGFDAHWRRCSPGMLLMAETIRHCAEAGLESYELMGVPEDWTRTWTENVRECVSIRTYPASITGAHALARDSWTSLRHRLRKSDG